ncbi:MAG: flagellar biosynthesis protein FlhA [Proteobacteria bacterium]|nr:flagellar biosynthesis protein FlhA [Pseudomonadota bacterium]
MAEGTTQIGANGPILKLSDVLRGMMRGDVAVGIGVVFLIVLLIVPLPSVLLDFMLAISISTSVLILMSALFMKKPLEFSSFPSILLVTTLFRLGLNIASTRLILGHGHEGTNAAGEIIHAFGEFIMGGNFVIGLIVFIILIIVNFVVITKGSTRIAEVAARFSLDAMPGKQMAIDADLSSGLITEDQARAKRKELEGESNFFGAMDGASKFVRGDAIAGLLITAINVIGGIIIGTVQNGLSIAEAGASYTQLTVGDGLVSQIPALIISVAAGLLVSKAGVEESVEIALVKQMAGSPQALGMVSATAIITGMIPGMPLFAFWTIGAGAGYLAYKAWQQIKTGEQNIIDKASAEESAAATEAADAEEPITDALAIDELKIELGYGLLGLVNEIQGKRVTDQIKALRRQLAQDLGFIMPSVRILDNMALANNGYSIRVKEMDAGMGELRLGQLLVMDPSGNPPSLPGESCTEPAFGLTAAWVAEEHREEAVFRGYTVVDPATVLTTHLTEVIKDNMSELLSVSEVQRLVKQLSQEHQKLVEEMVPSQVSWALFQRVLQSLLKERISIRDLATIVEAIMEGQGLDAISLVEHVRARLARQLCWQNRAPDGSLAILALSPHWEQSFSEAIVGDRGDKQLALAPSQVHEFVNAVRNALDKAAQLGEVPVILTSGGVRPFVRSLIERFRPQTVVMSQNEIHPKAKLKTLGTV